MVVHSTVLCYIHPGLFDGHSSIQVHAWQLSVDYSHPDLQSTIHFDGPSVNRYSCKNCVRHAENNNIPIEFTMVISNKLNNLKNKLPLS